MIDNALISTRHEYDGCFLDLRADRRRRVRRGRASRCCSRSLRYRRRPPRPARWHENNRLEAGYALLLVARRGVPAVPDLRRRAPGRHGLGARAPEPDRRRDRAPSGNGSSATRPTASSCAAARSAASRWSCPAGEAIRFNLSLAGRDPLLLGPGAALQARPDPRRDRERDADVHQRRACSRAVRRVLRAAARRHGVHRRALSPAAFAAWARRARTGGARMTVQAPPIAPSPVRAAGLDRRADEHRPQAHRPEPGAGSLAFFLVGGVFALLMRAQLAQPNGSSSPTTPTASCSRCTARR